VVGIEPTTSDLTGQRIYRLSYTQRAKNHYLYRMSRTPVNSWQGKDVAGRQFINERPALWCDIAIMRWLVNMAAKPEGPVPEYFTVGAMEEKGWLSPEQAAVLHQELIVAQARISQLENRWSLASPLVWLYDAVRRRLTSVERPE
jgi:hypothetical protein